MVVEHITRTKLVANQGMMLTNGKTYGKVIFLALGEDVSNWYEISESEYEQILAKNEEEKESIEE